MNKLIPLIVLSCLLPLAANARTITATGDTLDHAESKIRQQAAREGATTYRITEARMGNQVHITAKIADESTGVRLRDELPAARAPGQALIFSRRRSRPGGAPYRRAYSRVNCDTLI